MAEIGSVQPGVAKPPGEASTGQGEPAAEPGPGAADTPAVAPEPGPAPATAEPGTAQPVAAHDAIVREPTVRLAVVGAPAPPAGGRATSFLERAVLRRRIRFLRHRRELALHDLGGFAYETHRLGESRPELTARKLEAIDAIDGELATLEHALRLGEELIVLHEPGISSCASCSTIFDSSARFCPACGRPTAGPPT